MKLREFLARAGMVYLVMLSISTHAFGEDDEVTRTAELYSLLGPVPSPLISGDRTIGAAYYDTLSILFADNRCSNFYGGSATAVDVFNRLFERAKKDYLPSEVGMRMSGGLISMLNAQTNTSYRMFEKISINKNGPFYRQKNSSTQPRAFGVGSFEANTREVRVLMLLHELGHLIKGPDGNWLLPDDGRDQDLSIQNSKRIEAVCGEQIRELAKTRAGDHLAKIAAAQNRLALADKQSARKDQLKEE